MTAWPCMSLRLANRSVMTDDGAQPPTGRVFIASAQLQSKYQVEVPSGKNCSESNQVRN